MNPAQNEAPAVTLSLAAADLLVIGGYFFAVVAIGVWAARRRAGRGGDVENYLVAGRRLTLPLFVGTMVSTWYGGIFGVGEIAYRDGLVTWLTQGVFWYVAYLVFAFVLAGRLRESAQITLPDQLGRFYGSPARAVGLVLNYVNVIPIVYVLSLGLILHLAVGVSLTTGVLVGTAVAVIYSLAGGFGGVVYTDFLQFLFMCVGVALVIPFCVFGLGGAAWLEPRLPETHLNLVGQYGWQETVLWGLVAFSTLVDPNFYQRCYAAKDAETARRGLMISVGFWVLFDVCTTFSGLYARALLPDADPRMAYPLLADQVLPAGLKGVFFAGVVATIMSTVDSYCFVGATNLSRDLYQRLLRPDASEARIVWVTRLGIVLTAAIAAGLALTVGDSMKSVWRTLGSLSTAAMLLPMLFGFFWRGPMRKGAGTLSMVAGGGTVLGWQLVGLNATLASVYPGIAASFIVLVVGAASAPRGAARDGL